MATFESAKSSSKSLSLSPKSGGKAITHYLPFLDWLVHYRREDLVGDLLGGVIVAIMLVPQGMAYAMLAGLPPQVGLYASIVPLIIYGLLGTSRTLAVGPVAIVSLLVASGVAPLADAGSAEYLQLALTLAFLVAIIQFIMGIVRAGFLVNFLSHPVVAGFTSAAAIVIGFSQLKHLIGVNIPRAHYFYEQVLYAAEHILESNVYTLIIGLGSIAILLYFQFGFAKHLKKTGLSESIIAPVSKSGPLVVVLLR
jgi:SulP family sulfate permease